VNIDNSEDPRWKPQLVPAHARSSDGGNDHFTTSEDGKTWTTGRERPFVPNGGNSKPTFDKSGDTYYLGWQEATRIDGVTRIRSAPSR
jgi:hypothetical protein